MNPLIPTVSTAPTVQPARPRTRAFPVAAGLVLALSSHGSGLEVLHSFTQETKIKGGFAEWDGRWYFTAEKGGEFGFGFIGRFDPATATLEPLHSFATDAKPKGGLVRVGNAFWLQGERGAAATGFGWIGRFDPHTGEFTELAAYASDVKPKSGLVAVGDALWLATEKGGTGSGSLDRFDLATGTLTTVAVLSFENGLKVESFAVSADRRVLYAGAREGGDAAEVGGKGAGTLLRMDTTSGQITRLAAFHAATHGAKPRGLTLHQNHLWFVMEEGGDLTLNNGKGGGTMVRYDLEQNTLERVHVFDGVTTGLKPKGLVRVGDDFYYVTEAGGASGLGVLGVVRRGTTVVPLADLTAETGAKPDFVLTPIGQRLVLTTELGGSGYLGTVLAWPLAMQLVEPPALQVARVEDGKLRLSWPDTDGEFVLQVTSALGTIPWQDWPGTPERTASRATVEIIPDAPAAFYRLRGR